MDILEEWKKLRPVIFRIDSEMKSVEALEEWKKLRPVICRIDSEMKSIEAEEKRIQEKREESYLRGLSDAKEAFWVFCGPIGEGCMSPEDMLNYVGYTSLSDALNNLSIEEFIERCNKWKAAKEAKEKAEQEELHVGDEIICISEYSLDYNKTFIYLGRDEYHMKMFNLDKMRAEFTNNFVDYCKTGRHFDSIPLPKQREFKNEESI